MAKKNSTCIALANMVLIVTIIGIILSATPVMGSLKENIIYEIEMIGGGLIVILAGLFIWNNYVKRSGFKEERKNFSK